jgi:hypothetical protein
MNKKVDARDECDTITTVVDRSWSALWTGHLVALLFLASVGSIMIFVPQLDNSEWLCTMGVIETAHVRCALLLGVSFWGRQFGTHSSVSMSLIHLR